jgi:hypothetical protein
VSAGILSNAFLLPLFVFVREPHNIGRQAIHSRRSAVFTKLGELYSDLAREAFKPYQTFVARVTPR